MDDDDADFDIVAEPNDEHIEAQPRRPQVHQPRRNHTTLQDAKDMDDDDDDDQLERDIAELQRATNPARGPSGIQTGVRPCTLLCFLILYVDAVILTSRCMRLALS
jgi:hypothetical protein